MATGFLVLASLCVFSFIVCPVHCHVEEGSAKSGNETQRYQLFTFDFHHVEVPYVICLWVLLASVAKIGFHLYDGLSSILPESCLLIVMGIVVGLVLHYTHTANTEQYTLDADIFFLFLLPPIIYDAGYHMPLRAFFNNLGSILILAVINTLWNTVAIGLSLWAVGYLGWLKKEIAILHCFMFSALISAVDPVAVLAVFEDIHVNEMLYIVVFGESLLNDGVTVVLYHMMEGYAEIGESNIQIIDYATGFGSFFIIALGGTLIGVLYGAIGGFITKYTEHVRIIEPLFVFVLGYLAYLTAEMMHLSGILALTFGGITMRHYVEANMNEKSITTTKYSMKMMANISETVIFMFLGLSTIVDTLDWQWDFIFFSILFCIVYRVAGIMCLSFLMNRRRVIQLTGIDQFIMSYGGLRGGIAFCLSLLIKEELVEEKRMFITATIIVVFFTVFIQGITIKPVVNALKVKRKEEKDPKMSEILSERLIDHLMAGLEDIIGRASHNSMKNRFEHFNIRYLKPLLLREKPQTRETTILSVLSKLNVRDAMQHISSHGSFLGPLVTDPTLSNGLGSKKISAGSLDEQEIFFSPPSTVVDIHSVEAVYSKRDKDDTQMHNLLEDAMVRPRRTANIERRHTIQDADIQGRHLSHHQFHQQLRRLISLEVQRQQKASGGADEGQMPPDEEEREEEMGGDDVKFSVGGSEEFRMSSMDSGLDNDNKSGSPVEETEAERVLPWKRTTQLPPVRLSVSLSMPDDDHPLMSQAPSWADNLAYNHLTESGSPYVSPENTIGAPDSSAPRRPVFDIFPPSQYPAASPESNHDSPTEEKPEHVENPLPPPWTSQTSLPPPWASDSSEEPPLTSPEAHDRGGGEKMTTYLQSSSHNFYPPSHHNCLVSKEEVVEAPPAPSGGSVRGMRPANSPKHFQPLQLLDMNSRHVIEEEIIADEADYQERLVSRVQSWLDTSEPSDDDHDFGELKPVDNTEDAHDESVDDIDLEDLHIDTYL
ncbi:hypothetical protein ACOMHN_027349 [Nucella lapillus]